MLSINNLTYQTANGFALAIDQLTLAPGCFTAILGPNGAGKSTIAKLITGEHQPKSGRLDFHQQNLRDWPRDYLARHLAVLPQKSDVAFGFTAAEIVELGTTPLSISRTEKQQLINRTLLKLDCLHLAQRVFSSLSGGQQQRVQLARVLVQLSQAENAPLLILDEPTSAQDLRQQHLLLGLVKSLVQRNFIVVAVLHDINQACAYADQVVIMQNGRINACGTPNETISGDVIEAVWGYQPRVLANTSQTRFFF